VSLKRGTKIAQSDYRHGTFVGRELALLCCCGISLIYPALKFVYHWAKSVLVEVIEEVLAELVLLLASILCGRVVNSLC